MVRWLTPDSRVARNVLHVSITDAHADVAMRVVAIRVTWVTVTTYHEKATAEHAATEEEQQRLVLSHTAT